MTHDQIRYDILVQDALRSVIRKVLSEVAKAGLPGDHHFFITFSTIAPGVKISQRLKERYHEQMTIVIQHRFWDLNVSEHQFEISLSFNEVLEKLVVPFSAIQIFYDPAAAFEAAFDLPIEDEANDQSPAHIKTVENNLDSNDLADNPKIEKFSPKSPADNKQTAQNTVKPSADVVSLNTFRRNRE